VWVDVRGTFIPTEETSEVTVVVERLGNASVSGSAWFDDIKVYPSDSEEVNLLTHSKYGNTKDYARFYGDTPTAIHFGLNPGEIVVSAGLHGLYKSIDGGDHFEYLNADFPHNLINNVRLNLDGSRGNANLLVAGFNQAGHPNYISDDGGDNWKRINLCSITRKNLVSDIHPKEKLNINHWATPTGFHPTDDSKMIHPFHGSLIYKSVNNNGNDNCNDIYHWKYASDGYSGGRATGGFSFGGVDNPRTSHFFLTDYGPFVTRDGGRTWNRIVLPEEIKSNNAAAGDVVNQSIVAAIGSWKSTTHQQIVFSDNGGDSWHVDSNQISAEGPLKYKFVAFDPVNEGIVYADN
jgi:hypothetical protein